MPAIVSPVTPKHAPVDAQRLLNGNAAPVILNSGQYTAPAQPATFIAGPTAQPVLLSPTVPAEQYVQAVPVSPAAQYTLVAPVASVANVLPAPLAEPAVGDIANAGGGTFNPLGGLFKGLSDGLNSLFGGLGSLVTF
ncbi:hypothetical protein LPJ66_006047 [Kickxella alabastrina]|uniref:Uncharacterized protein n=1 Tax=Kickxella alabastrina TaxID=61397 RepID=A0ACC1IGK0_9FUNG|nr:hypothetical protein LPJ66_006047 [Kickxella alabastrina]